MKIFLFRSMIGIFLRCIYLRNRNEFYRVFW